MIAIVSAQYISVYMMLCSIAAPVINGPMMFSLLSQEMSVLRCSH